MLHILTHYCRAAANHYFHFWWIYWLCSQSIHHLVNKLSEKGETCPPRYIRSLYCMFSVTINPKYKDIQCTITQEYEDQHISWFLFFQETLSKVSLVSASKTQNWARKHVFTSYVADKNKLTLRSIKQLLWSFWSYHIIFLSRSARLRYVIWSKAPEQLSSCLSRVLSTAVSKVNKEFWKSSSSRNLGFSYAR